VLQTDVFQINLYSHTLKKKVKLEHRKQLSNMTETENNIT